MMTETQLRPAHPAQAVDKTVHAIVNPAAGGGRCRRRWEAAYRMLCRRGWRVEEHRTTAGGEATGLAREIAQRGGRELLVAGGDGTVNEAINGLFAERRPVADEVVVTVLPCGTGSDFAKNLGITVVEQALERLENGSVRAIDLGRLHWKPGGIEECRYFVNSADVGYGAETAAWVNGSRRVGGRFAYLLGGFRTILKVPPREVLVRLDGQVVHEGPSGMVVIANGRYHAGGMLFAPNASLTDGLLDVLVLEQMPNWRLLVDLLPRVYHGGHIGRKGVRLFRGREVQISAPDALPFEVDGEQLGKTDLWADIVPQALRVRM
jgi:diacylglycerol kinase (ATP)